VILYGLTAILGDLISLSALHLVWWRVMLTSLSLLFFVGFGRQILNIPRKDLWSFIGIGAIVAFHWVTFYGGVKLANASVTLVALATTSLFTSLLEPLLTDKKLDFIEVFIGLLIIPPLLLIANNIDLSMIRGFQVALLSAFLAAIFSTLNKKLVDKANSYQITFVEMASAFVFISLFIPFLTSDYTSLIPQKKDWLYLIFLSLGCTTFAFIITMKALKHVPAFDANLVINLEPVYGIILAIVLLKENTELSTRFYWGALLILLIVFSHPLIKKYKTKKNDIRP